MDTLVVNLGFFLSGVSVGYFAFLAFRISIHQQKFSWSGATGLVTALSGGGFLTYFSGPTHFAWYAIGFYCGMVSYLSYLKNRRPHLIVRESAQATHTQDASQTFVADTATVFCSSSLSPTEEFFAEFARSAELREGFARIRSLSLFPSPAVFVSDGEPLRLEGGGSASLFVDGTRRFGTRRD